jgi:hypothetical protein
MKINAVGKAVGTISIEVAFMDFPLKSEVLINYRKN